MTQREHYCIWIGWDTSQQLGCVIFSQVDPLLLIIVAMLSADLLCSLLRLHIYLPQASEQPSPSARQSILSNPRDWSTRMVWLLIHVFVATTPSAVRQFVVLLRQITENWCCESGGRSDPSPSVRSHTHNIPTVHFNRKKYSQVYMVDIMSLVSGVCKKLGYSQDNVSRKSVNELINKVIVY